MSRTDEWFFELGLSTCLGESDQLQKVAKLMDRERVSSLLSDVNSLDGPTGYPAIQMFKCLLLASWHSLSDPILEHSL